MVSNAGELDLQGSLLTVQGSSNDIFGNLLIAVQREHLHVLKRCENLELENRRLKSWYAKQRGATGLFSHASSVPSYGTVRSIASSQANDTCVGEQLHDAGAPPTAPSRSNEDDAEWGLPKTPREHPVPKIVQFPLGELRPATPRTPRTPREDEKQDTPREDDKQEVQSDKDAKLEHVMASQGAEQVGQSGATAINEQTADFGPGQVQTVQVQSELLPDDIEEPVTKWQQDLVEIFKELDEDSSGSLSTDELRSALELVGVPRARLAKLIRIADADSSGEVELGEWMRAVTTSMNARGSHELQMLSVRLSDRRTRQGTLFLSSDKNKRCWQKGFMLSPASLLRMSWDIWISVLCMYLCVALPFIVAWEQNMAGQALDGLLIADQCVNYMFILDIILNFRTGYYDKVGDLVMSWREVGKNYLMTWFLLDVLSCFPFDALEGKSATINPNRAIKIAKLVKLLRIYRLVRPSHFIVEDVSDVLSDVFQWKIIQILYRRCGLFMWAPLITHWLSCGMKLVDAGWLSSYSGLQDLDYTGSRIWSEYFTGFYWAMTTITTVGYGDITPSSDGERAFAVLSMAVGGAFYGYVVGAITSLVQNSDVNASAYYDRMDLIHAWLLHHRLPSDMKTKVRRHFKIHLAESSAISEAEVWADLSPELQREIGIYIIHEDVRNNPLFDGMSVGGVVKLQAILHRVTLFSGDKVAKKGEVGTAMYIIVVGWLKKEITRTKEEKLGPGQSFGEEVVLGLRENYEYTATVLERASVEMILESEFVNLFQTMPNLLERMRQNALEFNPHWGRPASRLATRSNLSRIMLSRDYLYI